MLVCMCITSGPTSIDAPVRLLISPVTAPMVRLISKYKSATPRTFFTVLEAVGQSMMIEVIQGCVVCEQYVCVRHDGCQISG